MTRPATSRARTLPLGILAASLGLACEQPPGFVAAFDAGVQGDAIWPTSDGGGVCSTPIPVDPRAGKRASCGFHKGAKVTDSLPLTEAQRAAIPIQHVIVVMKENRSFDHVLGNLSTSGQPEAEAIPASFTNADKMGAAVGAFHLDTTCVNMDPGHQWADMHRQVNGGAMDGFVVNAADTTGGDGHFVMGNYQATDVPFYYWLARTFAISDRHFSSLIGPTWPNRLFLVAATSCGYERCM